MKKNILITLLIVICFFGYIFYQKHLNFTKLELITYTSDIGNTMTNIQAFEIAGKSECAAAGKFTGKSYFNINKGGLVTLNMKTNKKCLVRCDVSIDNKIAKPAWMCTGVPLEKNT